MISRRTFLQRSALASMSLPFVLSCEGEQGDTARKISQIGLITGWMKPAFEADWEGTIEKVAAAGYKELEFGKGYGPSLEVFHQKVLDLGMKPIAGGAAIADLSEKLSEHIDQRLKLEQQYLVCYWPWRHGGDHITIDEVKGICEEFNQIGETCKQNGIRFAFHNHDKEFLEVEGQVPYDIFMDETEPDLVCMEIDLYWIRKGGGDVFEYFRRYPGRFELCHVKDMDDTVERSFATPGEGIIDFGKIFAQAEQAGLKHYFVEQDKAPDPIGSMQSAAKYLKALRF